MSKFFVARNYFVKVIPQKSVEYSFIILWLCQNVIFDDELLSSITKYELSEVNLINNYRISCLYIFENSLCVYLCYDSVSYGKDDFQRWKKIACLHQTRNLLRIRNRLFKD